MDFKFFNKKSIALFLSIALSMTSCEEQDTLVEESETPLLTETFKGDEGRVTAAANGVRANFNPNVFITRGVGYQGPSQQRINNLPRFVVDELPRNNATQRIQRAINQASNRGGGRVIIKTGRYVVGAINLKSNVHIRIRSNVIMRADQTDTSPAGRNLVKEIFLIGRRENIRNVSIVGEGKGDTRPKFRYFRESARGAGGARSFSVNGVRNCFIQNILIEDNQTRFSGVDFNFNFSDISEAGRPTNVTIDHCEIRNAAYGYGLVQLNCGLNILLSNLTGEGGVTARLESDNRTFGSGDIGIANAHVRNILTTRGKTGVLLQPWNVINGNVFIDGIHAVNCNLAVETQDGYMDTTGRGRFGPNSYIKNVTHEYGLNTTSHFAYLESIPNCLLRFFRRNDPSPDAESRGSRTGPSIAVVGDFITRDENRIRVERNTVRASVPVNTNSANTVGSRVKILTGRAVAHRGTDPDRQCGWRAYN